MYTVHVVVKCDFRCLFLRKNLASLASFHAVLPKLISVTSVPTEMCHLIAVQV